jgi:segregation and condensation protein B
MDEKDPVLPEAPAADEASSAGPPEDATAGDAVCVSDFSDQTVEAAPVTEAADDPDAPVAVDVAEQEVASSTEEAEFSAEEFLVDAPRPEQDSEEARMLAVLEAIVYVTDEPLSTEQIARALERPLPDVQALLDKLVDEYNKPEHGLTVKEVAGGYKMATKPEHHEAVRTFVKNLNPPLKLSLAALETLAVIAYKQPITAPEVMEIRGVQGAGVLKTLLDRKLITTAGRKNVVGKPILYKTTKEFLVQFGLKDLTELPTLKEFEDLRRMAFDGEEAEALPEALPEVLPEVLPETPQVDEAAEAEAQVEPESQTEPEPEPEQSA